MINFYGAGGQEKDERRLRQWGERLQKYKWQPTYFPKTEGRGKRGGGVNTLPRRTSWSHALWMLQPLQGEATGTEPLQDIACCPMGTGWAQQDTALPTAPQFCPAAQRTHPKSMVQPKDGHKGAQPKQTHHYCFEVENGKRNICLHCISRRVVRQDWHTDTNP